MKRLPLVIGMGGINAAGRTSFHQGFRRIVIDKLNAQARQETFVGLASLMKIVTCQEGALTDAEGNVINDSNGNPKKIINCEAKWSHLGNETQDWHPFSANKEDVEQHGKDLYNALVNGDHGAIADE